MQLSMHLTTDYIVTQWISFST